MCISLLAAVGSSACGSLKRRLLSTRGNAEDRPSLVQIIPTPRTPLSSSVLTLPLMILSIRSTTSVTTTLLLLLRVMPLVTLLIRRRHCVTRLRTMSTMVLSVRTPIADTASGRRGIVFWCAVRPVARVCGLIWLERAPVVRRTWCRRRLVR